jgi:FMN phosphatase YigB (HAD superfamily)
LGLREELKKPKDVVFFDGDGTLWYPRSTLRTCKPHWVYLDKTIENPIAEMIATPQAESTLRELGARGVQRVLMSTSPLEEDEALAHRTAIAEHVGIIDLLDDINVAPDVVDGKGQKIAAWLLRHGVAPQRALMVGDTYQWDVVAANNVGVDGLLLDSEHEAEVIRTNGVGAITINDLSDIIPFIV